MAAASELGKRVCIVDGSFQFGDVGVLLNLNPKNKSIADVIQEGVADLDSLESVLVNHSSSTRVLLAPPSPEMAELVTPSAFHEILEALRLTHDLVVVDSWTTLNEATLDLLDLSDEIVTLLTLEITNIKNVRLFLEVADQLGYGSDKIKLVLNRSDAALRHPHRRRRELHRPQDRRNHRERRSERGLRPQPGRTLCHQQP